MTRNQASTGQAAPVPRDATRQRPDDPVRSESRGRHLPTMSADPEHGGDCPHCRSAGSVIRGSCQVCDEPEDGTVDLPPAVPPTLRLSDALAELRDIQGLVSGHEASTNVVAACRRVESLLTRLRDQFLADVVEGRPVPMPVSRTGP